MKILKPAVFVAMGLVFFVPQLPASASPARPNFSKDLRAEEREYFFKLYQDTWKYFEHFVEPLTGVSYDSSARQPATSISNIGFSMTAAAMAYRTGLIPRKEARRRIKRSLDALEKIEKWRGFPVPWILVRTLKRVHGEQFSYASHLSVLIGGLVVTKAALPETSERIRRFLGPMRFRDLYDPKNGWLRGGYDMKTNNFAVFQPWGHWHYKYFASEVRLLSFYAIAAGQVPAAHWNALLRPEIEIEGKKVMAAGYEEAGLGVPYLGGLFLDERRSDLGESQKNYAKAQINRGRKIKSPVWGWASCLTPSGRYLSYGELRDEIVAPYASLLAALYFRKEAYKNLKKLETFSGLRGEYGFKDSINWQTGETARQWLTPSQGMAFLSLANLLFDGIVWKSFAADETVQNGLAEISGRSKSTRRSK